MKSTGEQVATYGGLHLEEDNLHETTEAILQTDTLSTTISNLRTGVRFLEKILVMINIF